MTHGLITIIDNGYFVNGITLWIGIEIATIGAVVIFILLFFLKNIRKERKDLEQHLD